ncbi:hypothetical protein [Flavobacterium pectinovorum]|uniref:Uncharacterized protein n=1 Tax=Flavobacterium pectinovorum TaxID=29533 RepID=A0A502E3M9_9FLAO|nr:hypothetical protein [Flavobacterium pectinovorum]TPG31111.1 hypothetical protein EAH81_27225 [Flavobacterium pectinovorum]
MRKLIYLALISPLFSNCTREENYLVAQNVSQDKFFGSKETLLLKKDSSFNYSSVPNNKEIGTNRSITGKYKIQNDTINLISKEVSTKLIFIGNQIQLLSFNAKMKVLTNNTSIKNNYQFDIPEDFTVFSYNDSFKNYFNHPVKATKISSKDFYKLQLIIQNQIDLNKTKFRKHKLQSDYFKQCIFVTNAKNEKEVWINGISKKSSHQDTWESSILEVNDGGEYYFALEMNLETGEIYYFSPHGLA